MFSIIMPAYNAESTLTHAIDSVLSQSDPNWELIVINDGSTDTTVDIGDRYAALDSRIQCINSSENRGVAIARNVGIDVAKGDYIAFLDADDIWYPEKLEKQKPLLDQGYGIVCSEYTVVDSKSRRRVLLPEGELDYERLLKFNFIGNLTGVYSVRASGVKYNQSPIGHEDYEMWLNIAKNEKIAAVREPLAEKHNMDTSLSSNKIKAAMWTWKIQGRQLGWRLDKRAINFIAYIRNGLTNR